MAVFYLANYYGVLAEGRGKWTPDKGDAICFGNKRQASQVARRVGAEVCLEF